jgi:putative DNA primase/helicase
MDEADTIFTNGSNAELRGILNAGLYRANAFILRCAGERKQPRAYSVWCPKAIALIGRLPTTLEDRSITIILRRRAPGEAVDLLHYDKLFKELEPLRRKAARWAIEHMDRLRDLTPPLPDGLHDRAQDLWRPLFAIAQTVGKVWMDRAQRAAVELTKVQPSDTSLGVQLLACIQSMFQDGKADHLSSEAITLHLREDEDCPWPDRLPATKAQLARLLAPFGIRPTIVYRNRMQVRRGYRLSDFRDAFSRYLQK